MNMYWMFFFFLVNILFISMYISGTISLLIVISQSCSTSRNKKTKQVQLAVMLVFNLLGDPFYITICFLQYGRSKNHSTIYSSLV